MELLVEVQASMRIYCIESLELNAAMLFGLTKNRIIRGTSMKWPWNSVL